MAKFGSDYAGLARHWICEQDYSECRDRRMFSEGSKLYSYGHHYLLAQITFVGLRKVIIINSGSYSKTTSKQKNELLCEVGRTRRFDVPGAGLNHQENIEYLTSVVIDYCVKQFKARKYNYKVEITNAIYNLAHYSALFKTDRRKWSKITRKLIYHTFKDSDDIVNYIAKEKGLIKPPKPQSNYTKIEKNKLNSICKDLGIGKIF